MANQLLSNGVTLNVTDEGSGTPVVFVHGVMMSGRFFDRQLHIFQALSRHRPGPARAWPLGEGAAWAHRRQLCPRSPGSLRSERRTAPRSGGMVYGVDGCL